MSIPTPTPTQGETRCRRWLRNNHYSRRGPQPQHPDLWLTGHTSDGFDGLLDHWYATRRNGRRHIVSWPYANQLRGRHIGHTITAHDGTPIARITDIGTPQDSDYGHGTIRVVIAAL